MSLNYPSVSLNYGPVYQVSTIPFVTSSIAVPVLGAVPVVVAFPYVTKNLFVKNTGAAAIRVGFSSAGITGSLSNNFFTLASDESYESDFRVSKVYVLSNSVLSASTATIVAGMTTIPVSELETNWSGTLGVG